MAWIYWNETEWLISLSSDGENWITIADKNLGATTVHEYWDTLSEENCGKFYQWWNNYWFPRTWSITTNSGKINASNYWPWNYYSSSTFRTVSPRDSSWNTNLWWWTTWTVEAMQWPCPTWYHIPTNSEFVSLGTLVESFWLTVNLIEEYLKLPKCWRRDSGNWQKLYSGDYWAYWATYSSNSLNAVTFQITPVQRQRSAISCAQGCSIRPFANTPVVPDYNDTWETLYWDELPDRPVPPEPPKPKLKRIVKWANYYFFWDNRPTHASGVTLNKSNVTLTTAWQTTQLVAIVTPENAVNKGVLWSSSDTTVATVSRTWLVTCVTPWSCTITATTVDGGATATCWISNSPMIDFLLVGWWGSWWWVFWWWWGWGGAIYCCNYILTSNINIVIWNWWTISWCRKPWNNWWDSCFWDIVVHWWWGWGSWSSYCVWWSDDHPNWFDWGSWWGWSWASAYCSWCPTWIWWEWYQWQWNNWWNWIFSTANYPGWGWWGWAWWEWWVPILDQYNHPKWWTWWNWICSDISWEMQWYWWWGWWFWINYIWCWWCWWWWDSSRWWVNQNWCDANYYWWWGWGGGSESNYLCWWKWCQWIAIVRYPTACGYTIYGWNKYNCGNYTIHSFTSNWILSTTPQPITTPWAYHNPSLWLISISGNWTTWITLADKNLWATEVYNDGDDLTVNNAWNYYQWWNNHGFTFNETPSNTLNQRVNVSDYWPWNYLDSDIFRTYSGSWDNPININLWWGSTYTLEAMRWPCPEWWHVPTDDDVQNIINILYSSFWLLPWYEDTAFDISKYNTIMDIFKTWRAPRLMHTLTKTYSWWLLFLTTSRDSSNWKIKCLYIIPAGDAWYFYHNQTNNYTILNQDWWAIRPFKNTPVQPDDSWDILYQ